MDLTNLFTKLYQSLSSNNYNSIAKIFTNQIGQNNISTTEFKQGLSRVGFGESDPEYKYVIKKYTNKNNNELVFLSGLEEDFTTWYEYKQEEDSKRQQKEEFEKKRQEMLDKIKSEIPIINENIGHGSNMNNSSYGNISNSNHNNNVFSGRSDGVFSNNSNSNNTHNANNIPGMNTNSNREMSYNHTNSNNSNSHNNISNNLNNNVNNNSVLPNNNEMRNTFSFRSEEERNQQSNSNINNPSHMNNTNNSNSMMNNMSKTNNVGNMNSTIMNNTSGNYHNSNNSNTNPQLNNNLNSTNNMNNAGIPFNQNQLNTMNNTSNNQQQVTQSFGNNTNNMSNNMNNNMSNLHSNNNWNPGNTNSINNSHTNNQLDNMNTNTNITNNTNHHLSKTNPNNFNTNNWNSINNNTNQTQNSHINNMMNANINQQQLNNTNNKPNFQQNNNFSTATNTSPFPQNPVNNNNNINNNNNYGNTQSFIRDVSSNPQQNNSQNFQQKFKTLDNHLLEELKKNEKYILSEVYYDLNQKYTENQNDIISTFTGFDPRNTGFIKPNHFSLFFDEAGIIVTEEEKQLVMKDIPFNENQGYYYFDFLDKIKNFRKEELTSQIRIYNLCYNDYIVKLRKVVKERKKDVAVIWKEAFGNKSSIKFPEFMNLMLRCEFTSLSEEEYNYLFNKMSEDNVELRFVEFKNIIKMDPPDHEKLKTSNYFFKKGEDDKGVNNMNNMNNINSMNNMMSNASNNSNNTNNMMNNSNSMMPNTNTTNDPSKPIDTSYIRNPTFLLTMSKKPEHEKQSIVLKRINDVDNKVNMQINNNKMYKTYEALELLNGSISKQVDYQTLLNFFMNNDYIKKDNQMTEMEIIKILSNFNLPFITRDKIINVLQSLKNKTPTTFSYKEFIDKIYQYNFQLKFDIVRKYNMSINDYVIDFREFISNNKIDIALSWDNLFGTSNMINNQQFIQLCNCNKYELSHIIEYNYLFQKLSIDNHNIIQMDLINILLEETKSVEDLVAESDFTSKSNWKKKISNYNEENSAIHKQHFQKYYNDFKLIRDKSLKENYKDLTKLFEDSNITPNGLCMRYDFINKISKLGVNVSTSSFNSILNNFANKVNKDNFNLVDFFNAYYAFFYKDRKTKDNKDEKDNKENKENKDSTTNKDNTTNTDSKDIKDNNKNTAFIPIDKNFKNNKPFFTQEELEYIIDMINFTVEIIFDEKLTDVALYYKNHLNIISKNTSNTIMREGFSAEEFKSILEDDMFIETDEHTNSFFNFLRVDARDETKFTSNYSITVDRIIQAYQKYSSKGITRKAPSKSVSEINKSVTKSVNNMNNTSPNNINNNTNTNNNQNSSNLKNEELLIKDFATHLRLNRIPWNSIFPHNNYLNSNNNGNNSNNNTDNSKISIFDFQNSFKLSHFQITNKEINSLVLFLDPNNKQYIPLDVLKNNIKRFQGDYFDLPFQVNVNNNTSSTPLGNTPIPQSNNNNNGNNNNNNNNVNKITNISSLMTNNPQIVEILKKMNAFIEAKKFTVEEFFQYFNKNGDSAIDLTEFIKMIKQIDNSVEIKKIRELYELIDRDNTNIIELNELRVFLKSAVLTSSDVKQKIDLGKKVDSEIEDLFKKFDLDNDGKISEQDFYLALKSFNSNTTMEDVRIIMKQVDKDNNKYVDKKEFYDVMSNQLKEQLVGEVLEKEYMIKLFYEQDIEKLGYLTIPQMKDLLINKLKCEFDYNGKEITEIINAVDTNLDGLIDINEFVVLLERNIHSQNPHIHHTIRQIHLSRKLNPTTFLSIFKGLPMNFIPSFLREEMKLLKVLPGSTLFPSTDISGILFNDISISESSMKLGKNYDLAEINSSICCKITFDNATGIPIPDDSVVDRNKEIVGRVLRVCFYNNRQRKFFGNCINLECSWKKDYEDRWYFETDRKKFNHNILIRYHNNDNSNNNGLPPQIQIFLVFEFVLFLKKGEQITEISCGWSHVDVLSLQQSSDLNLPVKGGTPDKVNKIEDFDIRANRTGFSKLFNGNKPNSLLPIKIKILKDLNKLDKSESVYLPTTIIIHKTAVHLAATYRKYIGKLIINHPNFNCKKIYSTIPIIKAFTDIVNCHDAFKVMTELWNQFIVETASSSDKASSTYFEKHFIDVVNRVNSVLYSEKFGYSEMDPSYISLGNTTISKDRFLLVSNVIRIEKDKKAKVENITPVESLSEFKPFSIRECKQYKISLVNNIDSVYSNKKIEQYYNNVGGDVKSIITNSRFLD